MATLIDKSSSYPTVINFNSRDRVGGTNSSFISKPVDLGINNYDSVAVVQASIPKSFYNIPDGYNTFSVRETSVTTDITIPPGSYNKNTLMTVLKNLLNTVLPRGWVYNITYPDPSTSGDTFKYTFTLSGSLGAQSEFIFTSRSPFRQLGFEDSNYMFSSDTLTSVNCINLSFILRAFIKTNLVQNATDSILEEILNIGSYPPLSVVHYQQYNFDMNTREYNPNNSNSWQFTLVDGFDQVIDLNGIPWAFSIVFYQRNKVHELHKTELEIVNEERLFKIEQQQKQLQDQLVDTGGKLIEPQVQTIQTLTERQIYPVLPQSQGIPIENKIIFPDN